MDSPIQFACPFRQGDFFTPVVEGFVTQTDVKQRWPDNSVKHAIFNIVVSGVAGNSLNLKIVEGQRATGASATWPIDFVMEHYAYPALDTLTDSWQVQDMINAGKYKTWIAGPLCTTLLVADDTGGYDGSYAGHPSFRARFHVDFHHTLHTYDVRVIGENANSQQLQEHAFSLRLKREGTLVHERAGIVQWRQSRWTLQFPAQPRARTLLNLQYLTAAKAIANWDYTLSLSEAGIAGYYADYNNSALEFLDSSSNPRFANYMKVWPDAGAQPGIGPMTTAAVMALYSDDPRVWQVWLDGNNLVSAYPYHYREGNPSKAHFGDPLRIDDRPTIFLGDIHSDSTAPDDRVQPVGDEDTHGYSVDIAHMPDPFYTQYLLTGDYFALEEMRFMASFALGFPNGAAQNISNGAAGRGPTGTEGTCPGMVAGQIRGQAWSTRNIGECWFAMPDDMTEEKSYLWNCLNNRLAIWEGERNIQGNYQLDPKTINHPQLGMINCWDWGNAVYGVKNILHFWEDGQPAFVQVEVDPAKAAAALSQWEQNFIFYALTRLKALGVTRAQALIDWLAVCVTNETLQMHGFSGANRVATVGIDGALFTTWAQVIGAYFTTDTDMEIYDAMLGNPDHGYSRIARTAIAVSGNTAAWAQQASMSAGKVDWSENPKWAIVP